MGIFELNKKLATLYGNLEPINPPLPFYLNISEKFPTSQNNVEDIIYTTIKYILNPHKITTSAMYNGNILIPDTPSLTTKTYQAITTQFMSVKKYYDKLKPYPIKHLTITFASDYHISAHDARNIAESILYSLRSFDSYQYLYAVHDKQWNYEEGRWTPPHIHFLINTTNYKTGKTLDFNQDTFDNFRSIILHAMNNNGILDYFNVPIHQISRLYKIPF